MIQILPALILMILHGPQGSVQTLREDALGSAMTNRNIEPGLKTTNEIPYTAEDENLNQDVLARGTSPQPLWPWTLLAFFSFEPEATRPVQPHLSPEDKPTELIRFEPNQTKPHPGFSLSANFRDGPLA